jgi:hypothetical protein
MAEKQMEHNTACKSEGHNKHLCHLMYEGFHFSHSQEYKEIVQNANFRCQNCDRTANQGETLCEPIAL